MENHWLYGSRTPSTSNRSRRTARSVRSAKGSRLRSRHGRYLSTRENDTQEAEEEDAQSPPRYDVTCKPHGLAVIIAVENYNRDEDYRLSRELPTRPGTQDEVARLRRILEDLDYTVLVYPDLTACQLKMKSDMIAEKDHTSYDSFICCVLSRGTNTHVYGSNGIPVRLHDFIGNFTGSRCPSLGGKPKLFFVESHPAPKVRIDRMHDVTHVYGEKLRVRFSGYHLDLKCDFIDSDPVVDMETDPSDLDFLVAKCVWKYRTRYPPLGSSFLTRVAHALERANSKRDMFPAINEAVTAFKDEIGESEANVMLTSTLRKELYLRTNCRAKSVTFRD
ncbi:uncharacterized protein LOC100367542 [Saccoglossus kowalevskii]|uniref:Caspase-8-like n=1 Tax=Saccoglossus kowalevskii TaxID=10224 RepID=A0ABM0GXG0_SACKO|nr:PREDICTED: caspase-8-like [Saccoglossus kowalevskii]